MVDVVLNERIWAEDAIRDLYQGKNPMEALGRIAKYYRHVGHKRNDVHRKLEEYLIRCNPTVNLFAWQDSIEAALSVSDKYKLIEIPYIPVTSEELAKIATADGIRMKRVLFTLLCSAKYLNAVNPKNNNWVHFSHRDVFQMANVSATIRERATMIHTLYKSGFISFNKIVDNTNMRVEFVSENNDNPELKIDDFRNLGNQYSAYAEGGYMPCQCCGIFVKRTGRRQRYCKKCATAIDNESLFPPDSAA